MEKDRKIKTVAVAAVLVAIIGLSIAFAALSQTLTINGTAKQEKSTWQLVWEKIAGENFVTTGTAEVQENYPTLSNNDTNLNLGTITLKKPGDKVTYRVNMANNGDIDAKVTGVTGVSLDNTYVSYSVKYLDNNTDITAANGRLLAAGAKKLVLIEVKFKESVTTEQFKAIPQEGITVDFNQVSITYSQNDGTGTLDPEPQGYSFTLNQLTQLSGYGHDSRNIVVDSSEFWNLIGEDLSQNSIYTTTINSINAFAIESDSNVVLGLNDTSIIGNAPSGAEFLVMVSQNQTSQIAFSISNPNGDSSELLDNNGFQEFLNTYGDVTFTFVDASNMVMGG